mgnify:CR=1 FL=1
MKKRILSILLLCCMVLTLLPTAAFAAGEIDEQFTLAPGGTYYFDLSAMGIPGTVNDALPDKTMGYVPFTYAGTVDSYKLTSEMATTEEYAETYKYAHSLFVADYAVTYAASWDHLNAIDMIFGKDYTAGGVDYTMRAPSEGSDYTGSGDSERGTPQSNEWDRILDKDDGYIKNWNGIFSCGQDTVIRLPWRRTVRGHYSSRFCGHRDAAGQNPQVGFRPVLGHEDLPVLYRIHGSGIDVDIWIEFLHGDLVAARFQKAAQRSGGDSFPQTGDDSAGYKYVFYRHKNPPHFLYLDVSASSGAEVGDVFHLIKTVPPGSRGAIDSADWGYGLQNNFFIIARVF